MATQADIDALEAALARGEKTVRFADGRSVEYRSPSEIATALAILRPSVTSVPLNRTTFATFARD